MTACCSSWGPWRYWLFMIGVLVLVGHFYPGSSAELVDWKPTRSPEVEVQNEIDDVRQMMEAQNEMRRRRGAPEMTEAELQREGRRGRAATAARARSVRGGLAPSEARVASAHGTGADHRLRLSRPRAGRASCWPRAGRCAGPAAARTGLAAIEAAGIEPALADPDRVGTVLEHVGDVAVVFHLLGSATGEPEALAAIHGPRLERLLEKLVDTPVRGVVYEAVGSVEAPCWRAGRGWSRPRRGPGTFRPRSSGLNRTTPPSGLRNGGFGSGPAIAGPTSQIVKLG